MSDPKRPTRAHSIILSLGADTQEDMLRQLEYILSDITRGATQVTSGGYSTGFTFEYKTDPNMTHETYFQELQKYLDELPQVQIGK